jgi:hypothetical protein
MPPPLTLHHLAAHLKKWNTRPLSVSILMSLLKKKHRQAIARFFANVLQCKEISILEEQREDTSSGTSPSNTTKSRKILHQKGLEEDDNTGKHSAWKNIKRSSDMQKAACVQMETCRSSQHPMALRKIHQKGLEEDNNTRNQSSVW